MIWPTEVKAWVELVQAAVTVLAIFVGGYWTYMLFRQKRQRYPRANIEHRIVHKSICSDKVLLHVTARLTNIGEVLLALRFGRTTIEQMMPIMPHLQSHIDEGGDPVVDGETDIVWPALGTRETSWQRGQFELEPNESDDLQFDFIIDSSIETVLVYSYFRNAQKYRNPILRWLLRQTREIGWGISTVYDLKESVEGAMPEDNKSAKKILQLEDDKQQQPRRIQTTPGQTPKPSSEAPAKPANAQKGLRRTAPADGADRATPAKVPDRSPAKKDGGSKK